MEKQRAATTAYEIEAAKIEALFNGPPRDDIAPDEVAFWHNVKMSEGAPFQEAMRQKNRADRAVWNYVENVLRVSQGLPKVGEGWVNEMRLYRAVEVLFPDDEVIHHYRADWLGRLELMCMSFKRTSLSSIREYSIMNRWTIGEAKRPLNATKNGMPKSPDGVLRTVRLWSRLNTQKRFLLTL